MANPQIENGYIRIAVSIFEALAHADIRPNEFRVLIFIIRKTYGWHKKADYIPLTQIQIGTKLWPQSVIRALKSLEKRQMIIIKRGGSITPNYYTIQKNFELWGTNTILLVGGVLTPSVSRGTNSPHISGTNTSHIEGTNTAVLVSKDIKIKDNGKIFEISQNEVKELKKIGHDNSWIKNHFLMRDYPENVIDLALGKHF